MSIYVATFAVIDAFEQADVPYMLSGSLSSMYYSFPRSTTDSDFVVDLGKTSLTKLAGLLLERWCDRSGLSALLEKLWADSPHLGTSGSNDFENAPNE